MSDSGNPLGGGMPPPQMGSPSMGTGMPPQGPAAGGTNVPGIGPVDRGETPAHTEHNYHKAVFKKIANADRLLRRMREEIDKLADMRDTVTPEDVISAAGRVVGHGVPAREMATLLATMPSQAGQGLAAWISQQEMLVKQQEAEVARVKDIAAFNMGVSATRAMALGDLKNQSQQRVQQVAGSMGPLAPGGNQATAPAGPQSPPTISPTGGPAAALPSDSGPLSPAGGGR